MSPRWWREPEPRPGARPGPEPEQSPTVEQPGGEDVVTEPYVPAAPDGSPVTPDPGQTPEPPRSPGPAQPPGPAQRPGPAQPPEPAGALHAGSSPAPRPARRATAATAVAGVLVVASAGLAVGATVDPAWWPAWAGGVGTASAAPAQDQRTLVATGPGASVLGCPSGPAVSAARGTDPQFAAVASAPDQRLRAVAVGAGGALTASPLDAQASAAAGASPQGAPSASADAAEGVAVLPGAAGTGGAARLQVPRTGGTSAPSLAGLATTLTDDGDLRGLAASACAEPAADAWLVGGATGPGLSTRLVLDNPGATTATSSVTLLTGKGTVSPAGAQEVVVPAGGRVELLLEGLAGTVRAPVVHVTSSGGTVAPTLVQTRLAGLTPRGVEVVDPGAPPSTSQVVPGVVTTAGGPSPVLRLGAPGTSDVVVRWQVLGSDTGAGAGVGSATTVPAGGTVDVPLEALPAGVSSLLVQADQPVVAGVELTRLAGAPSGPADIAWAGSGAELAAGSLWALPADDARLDAQVVLANPADRAATVQLVGVGDGGARTRPRTVEVLARGSAAVDPAAYGDPDALLVTEVTFAETPTGGAAADAGASGAGTSASGEGAQAGTSGVRGALVLSGAEGAPADAVAVVGPASAPAQETSVPVAVAAPGRWP